MIQIGMYCIERCINDSDFAYESRYIIILYPPDDFPYT